MNLYLGLLCNRSIRNIDDDDDDGDYDVCVCVCVYRSVELETSSLTQLLSCSSLSNTKVRRVAWF